MVVEVMIEAAMVAFKEKLHVDLSGGAPKAPLTPESASAGGAGFAGGVEGGGAGQAIGRFLSPRMISRISWSRVARRFD